MFVILRGPAEDRSLHYSLDFLTFHCICEGIHIYLHVCNTQF